MSDQANTQPGYRVADLQQNAETRFELRPSPAEMAAIAADLGLDGLRKLRFAGSLRAVGKSDWQLVAQLGATVVQPCVVTLEPVTTRIDTKVQRLFVAGLQDPETEEEVEMPEDDSVEPLGSHIMPWEVMVEALALALPQYPRAQDATLENAQFTEPGKTPMRDEDARPFAGLAALKGKLEKDD